MDKGLMFPKFCKDSIAKHTHIVTYPNRRGHNSGHHRTSRRTECTGPEPCCHLCKGHRFLQEAFPLLWAGWPPIIALKSIRGGPSPNVVVSLTVTLASLMANTAVAWIGGHQGRG
jgi:hypothetical protein